VLAYSITLILGYKCVVASDSMVSRLVQNKSMEGMETVLSELEESCTISILTDVDSSSSGPQRSDDRQSNVNAILSSMSRTLSTSLETRLAYHYELVFSRI